MEPGRISGVGQHAIRFQMTLAALPSEAEELPLRLVNELGIRYSLERSCKLLPGVLLPRRYLLGLKKERIGPEADATLVRICRALGMPAESLIPYQKAIEDSEYLHFGYEENEKGCVYKAYLEFHNLYRQAVLEPGEKVDTFPMYTAFKWDALGRGGAVESRYTWHPSIDFTAMRERIADILQGDGGREPLAISNALIGTAAKLVSSEHVTYLEVVEGDNSRRSFDLNLYRAGLRLGDVHHLLSRMFRHYGIPVARFRSLYDIIRHKTLGHLSGGIDREGRGFLTFYYDLEYVTGSGARKGLARAAASR